MFRVLRSPTLLCPASLVFILSLWPLRAPTAQAPAETRDPKLRPIYLTTRIFQFRAPHGNAEELTDQIFKMRTSSLSDDEKWIRAFQRTYPGGEIGLLRTENRRVFRTANQTIVNVARRPDGTSLEVRINAAQSPGDGERPGTSLVPEFGLRVGHNQGGKPITYSIQHIEVESGMTYFYAVPDLKLTPDDYVRFFRLNTPAAAFNGDEICLVFAFSVDLDRTAEPAAGPARYFDERQSITLQERATRTVQPVVPAKLLAAGLGGLVRVRVEISPEGRVTRAGLHYSSFPEINGEALAAARQWEFPSTLFAENKSPITGFISFNLAARPQAASSEQKTKPRAVNED
jgi:TonB family protein